MPYSRVVEFAVLTLNDNIWCHKRRLAPHDDYHLSSNIIIMMDTTRKCMWKSTSLTIIYIYMYVTTCSYMMKFKEPLNGFPTTTLANLKKPLELINRSQLGKYVATLRSEQDESPWQLSMLTNNSRWEGCWWGEIFKLTRFNWFSNCPCATIKGECELHVCNIYIMHVHTTECTMSCTIIHVHVHVINIKRNLRQGFWFGDLANSVNITKIKLDVLLQNTCVPMVIRLRSPKPTEHQLAKLHVNV